ncbi:Uncharacterized conserved protein, DUF924 family [Pseudidiomarina planktonica]|uniref:Uncharacterized conserved protein, DUF924 family n=1 Tax=Pseudidiomarina planktonica TaxID=1323738 RepID=A0A1Y6E9P7_9GAMM|nr:DUF924 family protein [Pseudidiomarina planktonica]RUO66454.1 DUF924 domain-containing protein [Pseudidiomarina planktonica]SMQ57951.1 Uncharacterized conserved protein, DUF924 family [Pseudidiomarina planktonica]
MYQQVLDFWFEELEPEMWWRKGADLDAEIKTRFHDALKQAQHGELFGWRETPAGRLAEIIVLDQFSRNIYRDQPESFAQDPMALVLAQEAVAGGVHKQLPQQQRAFLLLPYMHSESVVIHEQAVPLFKEYTRQTNYDFELKHKVIIDKFGRYPHRNEVLGRQSTAEEIEFLKQPGSSF